MANSALILGGGGVTGVAWELGLLTGLAEAGVDLATADLVVGTSAGAAVAAQITSGTPLATLYAAQLAPRDTEITARIGLAVMATFGLAMLRTRDPQRYRAHIGAKALAARTVPEAERRTVISSRLPSHTWPDRRLLITAVDAASGEFVVFDRDGGAGLVDAVGASCAVPMVWPPVTIAGRRYIDGGIRSATNADLAAGYERVVVIAPIPGGTGPMASVATQVAALRQAGAQVLVIAPDKAARHAIGRNVLDPARRAPSARAGRAQAVAVAASAAAIWSP